MRCTNRVIAPDARGHGFSANASKPFRQADDLAALLRHLDLGGPAVLVGISVGALIAVDTALEHPTLVRALVVSGRGLGEPDISDPWLSARHEAQLNALAAGDIPGRLDGFVQWVPGPSRTLAEVDPEVVRHVKEMALRMLMKHVPDEPNHCVPVTDVAERAKEITVPVLAVNLDAPGTVATADALIRAAPNSRTATIDGRRTGPGAARGGRTIPSQSMRRQNEQRLLRPVLVRHVRFAARGPGTVDLPVMERAHGAGGRGGYRVPRHSDPGLKLRSEWRS
ncbi:alpha/beta hydrolase [Streptomyces sp. NPDC051219]|uniref:alpha/beta fold hydrolase n=1 Tax=Streptomyces sp. NPDC051219 TaxID=3155283 RepID=UPI00343D87F9